MQFPVTMILMAPSRRVFTCWSALFLALSGSVSNFIPIQEGAPYTMSCSGQTKSDKRNIYWIAKLRGKKPLEASVCLNKQCLNSDPRYDAEYSSHGTSYTSHFTVLNVSAQERLATFECQVTDFADQKTRVVASWNLSTTYQPPTSLQCQAETEPKLGDITVSCQIEDYYPSIDCEMFLVGLIQYQPVRIDNNHIMDSSHPNTARCSSVFYPTEPGVYSIGVNVWPLVANISVKSAGKYTFLTANVTGYPSVTIQARPNIHECPGETDLECRAKWFNHGSPRFEWILNNVSISEGISEVTTEGRGKYYTYVSVLKLTHRANYRQNHVTCVFFMKPDLGDADLGEVADSYTKILNLSHPSSESPHLRVSGESDNTFTSYLYIDRQDHVRFVCDVKDEQPETIYVTVVCVNRNGNTRRFVSNTSSVNFGFNNNQSLNGSSCRCSVQHSTTCFNSTTKVILVRTRTDLSRTIDISEVQRSVATYTCLGIMVVITLVFCIGILLYKYRNSHIYSVIALFTCNRDEVIKRDAHFGERALHGEVSYDLSRLSLEVASSNNHTQSTETNPPTLSQRPRKDQMSANGAFGATILRRGHQATEAKQKYSIDDYNVPLNISPDYFYLTIDQDNGKKDVQTWKSTITSSYISEDVFRTTVSAKHKRGSFKSQQHSRKHRSGSFTERVSRDEAVEHSSPLKMYPRPNIEATNDHKWSAIAPDSFECDHDYEEIAELEHDYISPSSSQSSLENTSLAISENSCDTVQSLNISEQEDFDDVFENPYIIPTDSTPSLSRVSLDVDNVSWSVHQA